MLHPLYDTLRKVVFKHLGLEDLVETIIDRMGDVSKIVLIGDYAKELTLVQLKFLIGNKLNTDYLSNLEKKIEKLISRKVTSFD